jgi:hypothetical protein
MCVELVGCCIRAKRISGQLEDFFSTGIYRKILLITTIGGYDDVPTTITGLWLHHGDTGPQRLFRTRLISLWYP